MAKPNQLLRTTLIRRIVRLWQNRINSSRSLFSAPYCAPMLKPNQFLLATILRALFRAYGKTKFIPPKSLQTPFTPAYLKKQSIPLSNCSKAPTGALERIKNLHY
ncbi:MAG: hypothetical protein JO154_03870 [Chitinophaga sp.]|uniref:hypothetical protein n=1 Tax=Chitinophaga sp. TaxID=1869181 RepID=UPI0025B87679|nr:hypothetical protein [Chitinophaga sp.]MBV8251722.1 hypothetical protein [Chitinophaga sp.]